MVPDHGVLCKLGNHGGALLYILIVEKLFCKFPVVLEVRFDEDFLFLFKSLCIVIFKALTKCRVVLIFGTARTLQVEAKGGEDPRS